MLGMDDVSPRLRARLTRRAFLVGLWSLLLAGLDRLMPRSPRPSGALPATAAPRAVPPPAPAARAAATLPLYGLSTHFMWSEWRATLPLMAQHGLRLVRFDVNWDTFQPRPGSQRYDAASLARLDAIMAACEALGLRVILNVDRSPGWANASRGRMSGYLPPAASAVGAYALFCRDLAVRYRNQTLAVALEIWNEPTDVQQFWRGYRPTASGQTTGSLDPAAYLTLVRAAYAAVKEVVPRTPILAGVLPQFYEAQQDYLHALYRGGLKEVCDGLSHHAYTDHLTAPPSASGAGNILTQLDALAAISAAYGDGEKGLWVTECGWPGHHWVADGVPDHQRGQYLAEVVQMVRQRPRVRGLCAYTGAQPTPADPDPFALLDEHGGLLYPQGSAFALYAQAARS